MELPPYRLPTAKATVRHMWGKAEQYLRKMGGLILFASIIVWFLSYYPRTEVHDSKNVSTEESLQQQRDSYIGKIGSFIEPVLEPLGFNWKVSIALISGTAAKELIVSTIGVLYSENNADENSVALSEKLKMPDPQTGKPDFTPLISISFMVFVLLYFPCLASIAAIVRESGSWKWGVFSIVYNTGIAWICAFIVYNVGKMFV